MEAPASITIIAESARQGLEGEYEREERYDRGRRFGLMQKRLLRLLIKSFLTKV